MAVRFAEYMLDEGSSLEDIMRKGISKEDITNIEKEKLMEMIAREYTANDFRNMEEEDGTKISLDIRELKKYGFSAKQMKRMGFKANELKDAGYSYSELKDAGFGYLLLVRLFRRITRRKGKKSNKQQSRKSKSVLQMDQIYENEPFTLQNNPMHSPVRP